MRNIIGIQDYGDSDHPETAWVGWNSEMCRLILLKNHKVVYEDEYHYWDYDTEISFWDFDTVSGMGFFDGNSGQEVGYMCADSISHVVKAKDGKYLVKARGGHI